MSDPGRITSNPHKVAQWKARAWCASDGHRWNKCRCTRCGQGTRTVRVTIRPDISRFVEAARKVADATADLARAFADTGVTADLATLRMQHFAKLADAVEPKPSPFVKGPAL